MKFISAHFDQIMLLPPDITEKIPKGHKCFFIQNIVRELDLSPLISEYSEEGRPAYHPEIILSLLFCAYTDGITSSRVIAQKACTDVVYMYLAGMLEPDFRTIADFRKDHLHQIKEYFRKIVEIAVIAGVSSFAQISIDGSKIKANASKKCLKTAEKLDELIEDVEKKIADHLERAVQTDEEEDKKYGGYLDETSKELAPIGQENFKKYIKEAKERLEKLQQAKKELQRRKELIKAEYRENHKVNLTDVEAVLMDTPQGFVVGYNSQLAVDNDSKLIGAWDLSQERNDRKQLRPMVEETIDMTARIPEKVMADSDYHGLAHLEYLKERAIDGYIPEPVDKGSGLSAQAREKRFSKLEFKYDAERDEYLCPAKQRMQPRIRKTRYGRPGTAYKTDACAGCPLQEKCIASTNQSGYREFYRDDKEYLVEEMRAKMQKQESRKDYYQRQTSVEPVFGNLKFNLGFDRFRMRGLRKVKIEFGLMCIAHNLNRLFKIAMATQNQRLMRYMRSQGS
jgi:transposase